MAAGHLCIIEDEKRLRDTLETLLREEGYVITTAANGQEGIQYLRHHSVDVVITDLKMEGVDGFGVMEYVATHRPEIPVIVITAYASTESVLAALRRGAYDYITKPFEFELMQATIERALEKVRLQRQVSRYTAELEQRLTELTTTTVSKHFVDNIIRCMADMLFVINTDGRIRTINEATTRILDYSADELLGQPWYTIYPAPHSQHGTQLPATLPAGMVERHDTTLLARGGRHVVVSLARSSLYDDTGILQGYVYLAQDISARQRAHEALRASEAWLRLLTTQIPAVVWTTDTTLKLTDSLGAGILIWQPFASHDKDHAPHQTSFQVDDGTEFVARFAAFRALQGESVSQEVTYSGRTFHAHIEPLRDLQGSMIGTIGVALDITERHWQEEQRRKIAYEIQDGIAQLLVSAQQHLDTFTRLWHHGEAPAEAQLNKGVERLNQAIVEARHLMAHLHPVALETRDLLSAIRWRLEELGQEAGWEIEYVDPITPLTLPPEKEAILFRIVEEALSNAWKHAHTAKVRVECTVDHPRAQTLSILIRDWGIGFLPGHPPGHDPRLGLLSMQERAQMLGGTCVIESRPGQGTTVRLRVPYSHPYG